MKNFFIIAALAGCLTLASCSKESPEDYAKKMAELSVASLEAQINGEDATKYEKEYQEIAKEIEDKAKDEPGFDEKVAELYFKLVSEDPKYKELVEKYKQQMWEDIEKSQGSTNLFDDYDDEAVVTEEGVEEVAADTEIEVVEGD